MSREIARVRERYRAAASAAFLKARENLAPYIEEHFLVSGWGYDAEKAYREQWSAGCNHPGYGGYDWLEIWRRHRDPGLLQVTVWGASNRLSALALCLAKNKSLEIRFMEGNDSAECHLHGKRALIILEAATCYAQAIGKTELRIEPVNDQVRDLYVDGYGFELTQQSGSKPCFRRSV